MRSVTQRLFLAGGLITIASVLLPPMTTAAGHLFAFHMAQHLLLIALAAPLLVLSRIFDYLQHLAAFRKLTEPVPAWSAFVGIFLFWHWPGAFQWAAANEASRLLEHGSILFGALLFWSFALSAKGHASFSYGGRALFVMAAAVATDLPGVIMVFSPQSICVMPSENTAQWGLTPMQDQQIAGMLMWVPANLVFFGIATWLFALWISDSHEIPSRVTT